MKTMPSRQRGLSLISWMVVLVVVAILGTAAFRMVPAYLEYNTISTAVRSLLQDSKVAMMSESELRQALDKRFLINQVEAIKVDDLVFSREGGVLIISTDYEVREPMFYNVSIVMTFKEEFSKDVRQ
ncbi:DUF4845 domain-containing protein [Alcanivorax sediminis]|uniref:DUF4845 domain-containing protein n=1 Tax=Alcanivorax sediminis TaxID=2663008 RepID=A0A6N7LVM0_9GAMM|nr:DUF4845 domain-containing protein [Alcanivorax sediminis]MQX54313.1 DUF4845 domain-containing protein [Alcanivorax sediminis]